MKKGSTREFLETITSQDAWLKWRERHFFINGCCQETASDGSCIAKLEMYETDSSYQAWIRDVCSVSRQTVEETVDAFTQMPLFDGGTFWQVENELEWQ